MGTGSVTFGSGFFSGLDTQSIVDSLVRVKQTQLISPIESKVNKINQYREAFDPVLSAFQAMRTSAKTLKTLSNNSFSQLTATSSDTDTVSISTVNTFTAIAGTYVLDSVSQLAQADRVIFDGQADKDTTQWGAGSFTITYNGVESTINIESTDSTLEDIANAINDADIGVTAAIIDDGGANPYRLTLTGNDTGGDADFTISHTIDTYNASLSVDTVASESAENVNQDALFNLNGIAIQTSSNTVSDVIPGVSFNLLDTNGTGSLNIEVKLNVSKISATITDFVTKYAELRDTLAANLSPDDNGFFGPLSKDSILNSSKVKIGSIFFHRFKGLSGDSDQYLSLAEIGITTNSAGVVAVDSAKLNNAIESNPNLVEDLFIGDDNSIEDGIAEKMFDYIDGLTAPDGLFTKKYNLQTEQLLDYTIDLENAEASVERYKQSLLTKFNNLELVLAGLNGQQGAVDSLINVYSNQNSQLL